MKSTYIWGAGYYGILTALKFEAEGIKINGFIDKKSDSIKTKLGLPVMEPNKILSDKNQNFQIIIAVQNKKAINEIKEQLKKAGLKSEDDFKLSSLITKNLSETEISKIKSELKKIKEKKYTQIKLLTEKSKNIHFMFDDKFANPTIEFINKNFRPEENLFLVSRLVPENYTMQKFPIGENVIELNPDEFDYSLLNPKDLANKKLIFHSLFNQNDVKFLYDNHNLLKHSYWMVWGGDFYKAPTDEANAFVRQNIYGIGSPVDNDLIKQKYGTNHAFFDTAMVIFPTDSKNINFEELKNKRVKNNSIVIQVNHSADTSTLEMLDVLAKFKNENIRIKTILSYKTSNIKSDTKIQEIIDKGYEIFGDKFSYLDKMLTPSDYAEYLAGNDIMILNINQQSGVGNTINSIVLGKKVFIKYDDYFRKNKIEVFDPNKIKDMDFREFCEISQETIANNIKNMELLLSKERLISDFSTIFNDPGPSLKFVIKNTLINLKKYLKKPLYIAKLNRKIVEWDRRGSLKWMPDSFYLRIIFKLNCSYPLDLKNPKTFNEKIQWLKLYGNLQKYTDLVDKYKVRKYIAETIGEEYLIPLIGVWDSVDEIDFEKLPEQFVLKCNHDCASVIICEDKSNFDIIEAKEKLNKCLRRNFYYQAREPQYKNIKPKIICEKYMVDESGVDLKDYKFFCFNGKPKIIQIDFDRFTDHRRNLYDTEWNYIPALVQYPTDSKRIIKAPARFQNMLNLAQILSKNIPHVRVDFYSIYDKIYFGELTFTHGAGYEKFEPEEFALEMGSWLEIEAKRND